MSRAGHECFHDEGTYDPRESGTCLSRSGRCWNDRAILRSYQLCSRLVMSNVNRQSKTESEAETGHHDSNRISIHDLDDGTRACASSRDSNSVTSFSPSSPVDRDPRNSAIACLRTLCGNRLAEP